MWRGKSPAEGLFDHKQPSRTFLATRVLSLVAALNTIRVLPKQFRSIFSVSSAVAMKWGSRAVRRRTVP